MIMTMTLFCLTSVLLGSDEIAIGPVDALRNELITAQCTRSTSLADSRAIRFFLRKILEPGRQLLVPECSLSGILLGKQAV